jgi:ATP-dependent DNA ligase
MPICLSMRSTFAPCIPTVGKAIPASKDWIHEIKYDGYRLIVHRDGDHVHPITRGGYNWTDRYPWIVEAARKIRQKHFVLDGEAVILGVDGISDFQCAADFRVITPGLTYGRSRLTFSSPFGALSPSLSPPQ